MEKCSSNLDMPMIEQVIDNGLLSVLKKYLDIFELKLCDAPREEEENSDLELEED